MARAVPLGPKSPNKTPLDCATATSIIRRLASFGRRHSPIRARIRAAIWVGRRVAISNDGAGPSCGRAANVAPGEAIRAGKTKLPWHSQRRHVRARDRAQPLPSGRHSTPAQQRKLGQLACPVDPGCKESPLDLLRNQCRQPRRNYRLQLPPADFHLPLLHEPVTESCNPSEDNKLRLRRSARTQ